MTLVGATLESLGDIVVTGEDKNYPIQPHHINADLIPWGFFGNREAEGTAGLLILFFQEKGGWCSVSRKELSEGLSTKRGKVWCQPGEPGHQFFCELPDARFALNHNYIAGMFLMCPAKGLVLE